MASEIYKDYFEATESSYQDLKIPESEDDRDTDEPISNKSDNEEDEDEKDKEDIVLKIINIIYNFK